jgi:hypothetical protein
MIIAAAASSPPADPSVPKSSLKEEEIRAKHNQTGWVKFFPTRSLTLTKIEQAKLQGMFHVKHPLQSSFDA